jgi:hypothetical protein
MSLGELDLSLKSDGNFSDHLESPLVQLNQQNPVHIQARSFDDKEEKRTRTLNEQQDYSNKNYNDNNNPGDQIDIETSLVIKAAKAAAKKALEESTTMLMSETNSNVVKDDSDTFLHHPVDNCNLDETADPPAKELTSVRDEINVDTANSFSRVVGVVDEAIKPNAIFQTDFSDVIYNEREAKRTRMLIEQIVKAR